MRDLLDAPVPELKGLLAESDGALVGVVEKRELVRRVIDAGAVDVIPEPEPVNLDDDAATIRADWSVREIKDLMRELDVDSSDCLEKNDLVDALLASGRVVPSPSKDRAIGDLDLDRDAL